MGNLEAANGSVDIEWIRSQILEWVEEDKDEIVNFCSQLVKCPTPSELEDTTEAMNVVKGFLDKEGLSYKAVDYNEKIRNTLSTVQLTGEGKHLMFNGHLDVMPAGKEPGWTVDPWGGDIKDGMVWGRGTCDMKAGVTAELFAYKYLARLKDKLPGKVSISIVSDEETGYGRGTSYMIKQIEDEMMADCILSGEPSGVEAVSFCSKGYVQFTVKIATPGAIAGYSNESDSSIRIAADIIHALKELEAIKANVPKTLRDMLDNPEWKKLHTELRGEGHAELLETVTVDICTIHGGSLYSVIAPDCEFAGAVVYPVGTLSGEVIEKMKEIVGRFPEAELIIEAIDEPDFADPDGEMVGILQDVVESLGWDRPEPTPEIAISDCRYWRYRKIPGYWYGASGRNLSAADESMTIEEILHIVRVQAIAAATYLLGAGK